MDDAEDRRQMALLAAGQVAAIADIDNMMPAANEMAARCTCGKFLLLTSRKKVFVGRCECEKLWACMEVEGIELRNLFAQ